MDKKGTTEGKSAFHLFDPPSNSQVHRQFTGMVLRSSEMVSYNPSLNLIKPYLADRDW